MRVPFENVDSDFTYKSKELFIATKSKYNEAINDKSNNVIPQMKIYDPILTSKFMPSSKTDLFFYFFFLFHFQGSHNNFLSISRDQKSKRRETIVYKHIAPFQSVLVVYQQYM